MNQAIHRAMGRGAAFAAALLLAALPAQAITFGELDGNRHPYVGTLLFVQDGEGYYSCTGTLISPTVMLTAGHCVEGNGKPNDVTYVRFDADALEGLDAAPTLQAWLDQKWIKAKTVVAHPQYEDYAQFPDNYDVGVVILPKAVKMPTYGALPPLGLLDQVLAADGAGNRWTAVGYGSQGVLKPFAGDDYRRYQASQRLIELVSTFNGDSSNAKFSNNPGNNGGGTCYGDSGGPIFHRTGNVIGAVTSFGYTPCIGVDYQYRIDTPSAQDFIRTYLP